MFSLTDKAVAVYLGASLLGQMWGSLYQEPAQGAMAKLENILPDEQRTEIAWARRALVVLGLHRSDPAALSPLLEAIRRGVCLQRRLELAYQSSSNPEATDRVMDPYALVHRGGWWYLVGYYQFRQALRLFRVDRTRELSVQHETFQRPVDFEVRAYLDQVFEDQPGIQASLHFVPEAVQIARASLPGWESVQENTDGTVDVVL